LAVVVGDSFVFILNVFVYGRFRGKNADLVLVVANCPTLDQKVINCELVR